MDEKQRRTAEAQRLLGEPLLQEAFEHVEREAYEELLKVRGWRADKKRQELTDRINTIRKVKSYLQTAVVVGQQAAKGRGGVA